ncbi:cupin domain-containing protein [Halosimplex salinum]|uniref:cupin domain-containing protein n=1 Tax=Halosimplex salinum TaxID=1710538 RepID=UPI000F46CA33|nr:cupin domain-containing protein [Halosimplex salinum]
MERVSFDDAETYEPDEGWRRVALAGDDDVSLEWFEKPPGHSSPMHDHENGQVCLVLDGELTIHTEDDSERLERHDSVWLDPWESHRVENEGEETAVSLDIFVPGRSFDFWTDREE